jgi:hypothetical protein
VGVLLDLVFAISDVDHLSASLATGNPLDQKFQILVTIKYTTAPFTSTDWKALSSLEAGALKPTKSLVYLSPYTPLGVLIALSQVTREINCVYGHKD